MKCNQSRPGFELVSPYLFPTTITITPRALLSLLSIYLCHCLLLFSFSFSPPSPLSLSFLYFFSVFLPPFHSISSFAFVFFVSFFSFIFILFETFLFFLYFTLCLFLFLICNPRHSQMSTYDHSLSLCPHHHHHQYEPTAQMGLTSSCHPSVSADNQVSSLFYLDRFGYFIGCCFQDCFKTACCILISLPSSTSTNITTA